MNALYLTLFVSLLLVIAAGILFGFLYKRRSHPLAEPGMAYLAVVYVVMAVLPWTMLLSAQPG